MKIPTVQFHPQDGTHAGVELLELDSIYKRSPQFKFDPFAPHRVEFHHLIYITKGVGKHFIDFNHYPYQVGSFVFVNRHQIHAFDSGNQPKGLMILFTQEFLDSIRFSIRTPVFAFGFYAPSEAPVLTVNRETKKSCELLLTEIKKITGKKRYDHQIFQLLFTSLILKVHRERSDQHGHQSNEAGDLQFLKFLSLIEDNFLLIKDASEYADMMGVTYKTLNKLCKQVAHQTPKQLIDAYTILEAKRRLAIQNIQVTQLAYELGFEETTNFIRYFKKHTSMTPHLFKISVSG